MHRASPAVHAAEKARSVYRTTYGRFMMQRVLLIRAAACALVLLTAQQHAAQVAVSSEDSPAKPPAVIAVWDTIQPSAEPLAAKSLTTREGWNAPAASFKGDAVMTNGRAFAVVRQRGPAVEVYSAGMETPIAR